MAPHPLSAGAAQPDAGTAPSRPTVWAAAGSAEHRATRPARRTGITALPLDDLRIADFTALWAGPLVTHILGMLGADVVKVESIQRPDAIRYTSSRGPDVDQWWEYSWLFHGVNAGKKSVTLDLTRPEGLALAGAADRARPTSSSRTSPPVSSSPSASTRTTCAAWPRRPSSCACRRSASQGPWRDRVGLAQTMEQLSGLANLTGYADGPPTNPRGPCDAIAGMHAAFAALVAIIDRDRTGRGQLVESVMVNAALNVAAEQVIEFSTHGNELRRNGNRSLLGHAQGVYACAGRRAVVGPGRRRRCAVGGLGRLARPPCVGRRRWAPNSRPTTQRSMTSWTDASAEAFAPRDLARDVASLTKAGVPAEAVVLPGRHRGESPAHWPARSSRSCSIPSPVPSATRASPSVSPRGRTIGSTNRRP